MVKYVVYEVEFGHDNERWRGMEVARLDSVAEAEAFMDQHYCWCEMDVEE